MPRSTAELTSEKKRDQATRHPEVLAIVAYEQPVARTDITHIRGTDSTGVIDTLLARKLIADDARLGGRGRPAFLVTTDVFLRRFGLSSLGDLPPRASPHAEALATGRLAPPRPVVADIIMAPANERTWRAWGSKVRVPVKREVIRGARICSARPQGAGDGGANRVPRPAFPRGALAARSTGSGVCSLRRRRGPPGGRRRNGTTERIDERPGDRAQRGGGAAAVHGAPRGRVESNDLMGWRRRVHSSTAIRTSERSRTFRAGSGDRSVLGSYATHGPTEDGDHQAAFRSVQQLLRLSQVHRRPRC
ncbi:MAG: SMC-Scp complex subunit ScpB [Chloroflexi bacterium]|nr:SMC-Scp complex subunit ScpB [Chloroflexota bacterium]